MKHLLIFLIIALPKGSQALAQDSVRLDISDHLFYYEDDGSRILYKNTLTKKTIHLFTDEVNCRGGVIHVSVPKQTTLLINNKVEAIISNGKDLSIDCNQTINKISLYSPKGLNNIRIELRLPGSESNKDVELITRKNRALTNFLTITSMIILAFYAYNKRRSSELFNNHFKMIRALTIKTINETLFKIRVLEKNNMLLLIAHSMGIGLITLTLVNWGDIQAGIGKWLLFTNFWGATLVWMLLSAIVLIALVLKSALILSFATIFKLKAFARVHFYTHLRITLLIYIVVYLILLIFNYQITDVKAVSFTLNLALLLMILRIVIIFIKLMNIQSFRKVYLFSYICATEILPYIFLVKITYL